MDLSRRNFLKTSGLLSWGAVTANLFTPVLLKQNLYAGNASNNKRLIFLFQRGGNDGLNTVIPRGDTDYNSTTRPTLFIPENLALNSGNEFAQFHPALQPMMEIYNGSGINQVTGPGNLAVMHRIGYSGQSRSHFDSQFYWENGVPDDDNLTEGMIYRHLDRTVDLNDVNNSFVGVAISGSQMVALKGAKPIPNFTRASNYNLSGGTTAANRFLGSSPGLNSPDGEGLLGIYGGSPDKDKKIYRSLVHETGTLMGSTIETLQAAVGQGDYVPENGAVYPTGNSLGRYLQEAAMLIKRTDVKVLGVNIGGWDTHTNQGQVNGGHAQRLGYVAEGFQALYRDLQAVWDDVLIISMTEFGRTSEENGSMGTDHGEAGVMFAAGGCVNGGTYNCDATRWEPGAMFGKSGRYLSRKTDYRTVMGEMFTKHFGDDSSMLEEIIPGYGTAAGENPTDFEQLNYLRTS